MNPHQTDTDLDATVYPVPDKASEHGDCVREPVSGGYDLEDRTFCFAQNVRTFIKELPYSMATKEDGKQLIRSSGSVGANYIEANEALSCKDFFYRIRICRKEAKESAYWLKLLDLPTPMTTERDALHSEAMELTRIFSAISNKAKTSP